MANPSNLSGSAACKGRILGVQARITKADEFADKMLPVIMGFVEQGMGLRPISKALNDRGIMTASGKTGSWTPTAVKNLVSRGKRR
jgi:hypothetical protein